VLAPPPPPPPLEPPEPPLPSVSRPANCGGWYGLGSTILPLLTTRSVLSDDIVVRTCWVISVCRAATFGSGLVRLHDCIE
jgi:hypothetical protein